MLRKIFRPNEEEERGVWGKLHGELQNLHPPPNLIMTKEHTDGQNM
jgi:hypothetical protein